MVRITPFISVVIQRKAIKNQALLEKWIKKDNSSFASCDDDLICISIAMNPYDAKNAIKDLNKSLDICNVRHRFFLPVILSTRGLWLGFLRY